MVQKRRKFSLHFFQKLSFHRQILWQTQAEFLQQDCLIVTRLAYTPVSNFMPSAGRQYNINNSYFTMFSKYPPWLVTYTRGFAHRSESLPKNISNNICEQALKKAILARTATFIKPRMALVLETCS